MQKKNNRAFHYFWLSSKWRFFFVVAQMKEETFMNSILWKTQWRYIFSFEVYFEISFFLKNNVLSWIVSLAIWLNCFRLCFCCFVLFRFLNCSFRTGALESEIVDSDRDRRSYLVITPGFRILLGYTIFLFKSMAFEHEISFHVFLKWRICINLTFHRDFPYDSCVDRGF